MQLQEAVAITPWCDGLPRIGYRNIVQARHLPDVIRTAGLEWAARRDDGQGAIHSAFWGITRRPRTAARPVSPTVRAHALQPWTAPGEHYPNSPGRGRSFRCGPSTHRCHWLLRASRIGQQLCYSGSRGTCCLRVSGLCAGGRRRRSSCDDSGASHTEYEQLS